MAVPCILELKDSPIYMDNVGRCSRSAAPHLGGRSKPPGRAHQRAAEVPQCFGFTGAGGANVMVESKH